jgi:mono/diheme cytochrome c family protein
MRMSRRYIVVVAAVVASVAAAAGGVYILAGDRLFGVHGADPANAAQVARGRQVYAQNCAVCHGDRLQGQPDWRIRKADGKLPAPPHDESGHTWHHPDQQLFEMTKFGLQPFAPPGYQSDMPGFGGRLNDAEIWAVLAYIKSTWPAEIQARQQHLNVQAQK